MLMVAAGSCKKTSTADPEIVSQFVKEVKANRYEGSQELPAFGFEHIDALLSHASDEQLVSRFPWSPILSYYPGQKEVGLVMLYAIEVIRSPGNYPARGVLVVDANDRERKVSLGEVLPRYQTWWAEHKGKSVAQLRQLNPLEGTGLVWFGTEVPE
ncbi:protein of unknown function [Parapedobacter koreensis]|uniref:Uncharacterized protein n=2 Tax=Parapedobacter koreensis TaxID=332977 RepID=A0A1H7PYU7_9SPHI|nr:protein of unknown function [Parapedobacter koreensis]